MKFILGTKIGMTQVFREDGTVVPVTRVQAGPCVVTQVKTKQRDGIDAVQIGFGQQKQFRLNKAAAGHLKDIAMGGTGSTARFLRDVRIEEDHELKRGDVFTVSNFEAGEKVRVAGKSKGRGFQGVVKRHGFKGGPASHGHKDQERMPGSIGATDAARVFKGTRMGGHMGDQGVTVTNLEVIQVDEQNNELLIKGAVPGARGGLLLITTPEGKIEIQQVETPAPAAEEKTDEPAAEVAKTEEAPAQEEVVAEEKSETATEEPKQEEKKPDTDNA